MSKPSFLPPGGASVPRHVEEGATISKGASPLAFTPEPTRGPAGGSGASDSANTGQAEE
jgi:hypothetical protein